MPATQTQKTQKYTSPVPAFGIEADHPRNADLLVQGIQGCRLRSAIKPTKEVFDKEDGETITRPTSAHMFDGLPSQVPGMQLHVSPKDGTYVVIDPLIDDERALERIKQVMDRHTGIRTSNRLKAAKGMEGNLDKNRMKTLCREMFHLVKNGHAKVIKGVLPDMVDIEDLPGHFLLNASNMSRWNQPRYEKDYDEWAERMNRMGD